jgi:hypothetical protein
MARKPAALARELLRNFPKGRRGKNRRRRKTSTEGAPQVAEAAVNGAAPEDATLEETAVDVDERDDAEPEDADERDEPELGDVDDDANEEDEDEVSEPAEQDAA